QAISTTFRYDVQGRPVTITVMEMDPCAPRTATSFLTSTVSFSYNALGARSAYTVTPPAGCSKLQYSAHFQYRADGALAQAVIISGTATGTTSYTDTYLYAQGGHPLELLRTRSTGATDRYWYVLDGRNDVVALTDVTGSVVDRYSYERWG